MSQLFFVAVAFAIVLAVFWLIRSQKLREKYAALWIVVGIAVMVLALAPGALSTIAHTLGFQVPSNLLFLLAILLLLGVSLHLSLAVSRLEDQARVLVEEIAILRAQNSQINDRKDHDA